MLNEKMTSAERATLMGLVHVTLRTEESARLRYLKEAEVMGVVTQGAHGYKEVLCDGGGEIPARDQTIRLATHGDI
jgi:hypothetical protein